MPETTSRPPGPGRRRLGPSPARWWALAALSLSLLVVGLDTYVLNTALPTLSAKLGASTSQLQWITDAYTLAMAGVLLPAGQLGDRLGRRALLLGGLALFGVASVITSQVHTVGELIAMRALLAAAGLAAVVYGIIEQPDRGWAPLVLTALAGGAVLLAAFTARQLRVAAPLVDLRLFASRGFTWGSVAFAVVSFAMTGVLFVLTPYLQVVQGADAQATGLRLLPMIGAMLVSATVIEKSSLRLGPRTVIALGMAVSAAGLVVLCWAPAGGGYGVPAVALAVFGAGLGLSLPLSADVVLATLPARAAGAGNALNRALQRIAVCLAPAILGSVLNGAYRARLAGLPAAATASVAAAHAVARRLPAAAGRPLVSAANHAYLHGVVEVALISAAVLAVGAVLVLRFLPGGRSAVGESRVSPRSNQVNPGIHPVRPR
jgi:predicted MFS family arabinose efflux permease